LYCKTHYFKRFHEEGSYLGGDKFENKNPRDSKTGLAFPSADSLEELQSPVTVSASAPPPPPIPGPDLPHAALASVEPELRPSSAESQSSATTNEDADVNAIGSKDISSPITAAESNVQADAALASGTAEIEESLGSDLAIHDNFVGVTRQVTPVFDPEIDEFEVPLPDPGSVSNDCKLKSEQETEVDVRQDCRICAGMGTICIACQGL
jgi:hypothetical protein